MKKYLVKEIYTATEANENFKGNVHTTWCGKGDYLIATTDKELWNTTHVNDVSEIDPYWLNEYGYNRLCDAKRNWSYKNPENSKYWTATAEIIEVEF